MARGDKRPGAYDNYTDGSTNPYTKNTGGSGSNSGSNTSSSTGTNNADATFQFPAFDDSAARDALALGREQFDWQKRQAEERKRNIAESLAAIEALFSGREKLYDYEGATKTGPGGRIIHAKDPNNLGLKQRSANLNLALLNDTLRPDANRQLKFSLARAGTLGGSTDVDKNAELTRRTGLARGNIDIFAQSQADAMRAQDQALRGSLSALAASGGVTGDITRKQGATALKGLTGTASYLPGLNDVFSGLSDRIGGAAGNYGQLSYSPYSNDKRLQPWV